MKLFLSLLIGIVVLGTVGYLGLPFLLEKETRGLETEIQTLKKKFEKTESYIEREEKVAREAKVKPDAGLPQVIKILNNLSAKVGALESDLKNGLNRQEDLIKKQSTLADQLNKRQNALSTKVGTLENDLKTGLIGNEELVKKRTTQLEKSFMNQKEELEKVDKEQEARLQQISFQMFIGQIKTYILKVKENMLGRNFGLAKNDLEVLSETLRKNPFPQTSEQKKLFKEIQILTEKIKSDMESDVPAALSRMDLLWLEIDKQVNK